MTIIDSKTCRDAHVNVTVSRGLGESVDVVYLMTFEIRKDAKDEDETHKTPINNGSIGLPKMFAFNLLSTVRTEVSFELENGPVRGTFLMKTPYRLENF
jgi:hypothetical protein